MSLILAVDVAASVACCGVAVLPRAGVATTTATASWYVMDRQDVEVVILVVLVGVAPACCLLLAVVLQLDLGMLLLFFFRDGDAVVAKGCRWKGWSISLLVFDCFFVFALFFFFC